MTKLLGLGEAVSEIKDGSFITFSGMELNRAPMALVYGMVRQGRKGLLKEYLRPLLQVVRRLKRNPNPRYPKKNY